MKIMKLKTVKKIKNKLKEYGFQGATRHANFYYINSDSYLTINRRCHRIELHHMSSSSITNVLYIRPNDFLEINLTEVLMEWML